jgi:hypothetical protein
VVHSQDHEQQKFLKESEQKAGTMGGLLSMIGGAASKGPAKDDDALDPAHQAVAKKPQTQQPSH